MGSNPAIPTNFKYRGTAGAQTGPRFSCTSSFVFNGWRTDNRCGVRLGPEHYDVLPADVAELWTALDQRISKDYETANETTRKSLLRMLVASRN